MCISADGIPYCMVGDIGVIPCGYQSSNVYAANMICRSQGFQGGYHNNNIGPVWPSSEIYIGNNIAKVGVTGIECLKGATSFNDCR